MKKSFLLFSMVIFSLLLTAQKVIKVKRKGVTPVNVTADNVTPSSYTVQKFIGRWQEIFRTDRNANPVAFTDTLFFIFSEPHEVYSRNGVEMSVHGNAAVTDGSLEAAGDIFNIKSLNASQVVLDDGEQYIHTLIKKQQFYYETLPTNSVVAEQFTEPINPSMSMINGKWRVYRREAKPDEGAHDSMLIKTLNISEATNSTSATGDVTWYQQGQSTNMLCTITLNGQQMTVTTSLRAWQMKVYKADGKDLVFGDGSILYYCKPF